jgi:hypothetical protein
MQYGGVRAVKYLELQDLIKQANAFLKNNSSIGKSGKVRGEIGTLRKIISRQTKGVEVDDSTLIYLTNYFLYGKLARAKEIIAKGGANTNICNAMRKLIEEYGKDDVEIAIMAVGCNVERVSLYIRTQMSAEG